MDLAGFFSERVLFEISFQSGLDRAQVQGLEQRRTIRRAEFRAGRASAARLLRGVGLPDTQVARNADGSPGWPSGIVGSIAHSGGHVFVAIARAADVRGLGVDVEAIISRAMHDEIAATYLRDNEMPLVASGDIALASTICFSAKEALFKGLYPLTRQLFDFKDAEMVALDFAGGRLLLRLARTLSDEFCKGASFDISFRHDDSSVFAAFELSAERQPVVIRS